tara:strand:+ start:853 stop:954 length:102 start_codon:yes stop_codon:yes gene_type:complete
VKKVIKNEHAAKKALTAAEFFDTDYFDGSIWDK